MDHIDTPQRLREVDESKVLTLASSIKEIGLQTPITIWAEPDGPFQLVAGAHRLEAAKHLGWEVINAFFIEGDEVDRQLWEIDENLMRSELTPTQHAEHLAKRKELWEARQGANESGATCTTLPKTGRGHTQFAAATADATGVNKSTITRSISRAENVTAEARDIIRGTKADTGAVLDRLKTLAPTEQAQVAKEEVMKRQDSPKVVQATVKSKIDNDVSHRAAKYLAEILAEHTEIWDGIQANLAVAKSKDVLAEFTSITGGAIMDKRYGS